MSKIIAKFITFTTKILFFNSIVKLILFSSVVSTTGLNTSNSFKVNNVNTKYVVAYHARIDNLELLWNLKNATHQRKLSTIKKDNTIVAQLLYFNDLMDGGVLISDELQLASFEHNGTNYKNIDFFVDASEVVQLAAAKRRDVSISCFDPSKISGDVQMALLMRDVNNTKETFSYISEFATYKVQIVAVELCASNIEYVENPSKKFKKVVLTMNSTNIRYIKNPSDDDKLYAVMQDGKNMMYISEASNRVKLAAVKHDGLNIQYMTGVTDEIMISALQEIGRASCRERVSSPV